MANLFGGEKNLQTLLRTMNPVLMDGAWGFVTVPHGRPLPANVTPLMTYREEEGTTLILSEQDLAKSGLLHAFFSRAISLQVNSSLYAVGFLALISETLAKASMSINIVSAFHRDYIFVPHNRADEAVALLKKLAEPESVAPKK